MTAVSIAQQLAKFALAATTARNRRACGQQSPLLRAEMAQPRWETAVFTRPLLCPLLRRAHLPM
jgi:hypothetical protein